MYCSELEVLGIHFNTANIVCDFKNTSVDQKFEELRSLPRGTLPHLKVYRTPLTLDEPGLETVAKGMIDIFCSLQLCGGLKGVWGGVNGRIEEFQKMVNPPSVLLSLGVTSGFPFA